MSGWVAFSEIVRNLALTIAAVVGALALIMILTSPVCHTHYFVLSLPLVMGLLAWAWERWPPARVRWALVVLLVLQVVGNTLPLLPTLEVCKDAGLALYTALALWLAGCLILWRGAPAGAGSAAVDPDLARAA